MNHQSSGATRPGTRVRWSSYVRALRAGSIALAALALLLGCSREEPVKPAESVTKATEPLSAITIRTYGFESLSDWSPYGSSPTLSLSTTRVQGLRSLSVAGGGWSSVISRVLVKEDPAPTTVGFDLRIPSPQPNPSWFGTVQLFVSIPSQNINNLPLGLHDLITWTPGQWKRAEFNLPANVQAALNTNFNDLRWRIELNRPSNATAGYLFDRFTYGPLCTPVNDNNPCTVDSCSAEGQPIHTPVPAGTSCSDSNACNGAEACNATGTCVAGTPPVLDDGSLCTADACDPVAGVTHTPVPAGTSCSDGNACNGAETCDAAAACVSGTPVTCTASDQCHDAGTCDPATGLCSNPEKSNGTVCNDADACTQSDTCQAGVCSGSNPVVCAASDQCHEMGTCNPATGVCSNPERPTGAACNDANACTQTDTCQAGACTGSNPLVCAATDQCHEAGTCSPATGTCSNPEKPNGTACDDTNACTQTDACQAGACTGSNPVVCAASDQCHEAGTCEPATGVCSNLAKPDGSACNDADACTQADTCQAGACTGSNPLVCTASDQCHEAGTCDPSTGVCSNPAKADGSACTDDNVCTVADSCQSGTCVAGSPMPTDDDNPCTADACEPVAGVTHEPLTDVACDDEDICNGADFCDAGQCVHETTVDDGNPCTTDACDPQTGETTFTPVPEGTACGDVCSGSGTCDAFGSCEVTTPSAEIEDDENPCTNDVCDPQTGETIHEPLPPGTSCDFDSNGCISPDTCNGEGVCIAGTPLPLEDGNPCTIDECVFVAMMGLYVIDHAPAPTGTICGDDDSDPCNGILVCDEDTSCSVSRGTDDGNSCTTDSCDPVNGVVNELLPPGSECDDGNLCTGAGTCHSSGVCQQGDDIDVDQNPCTEDICNPDGSIVHIPVTGASCDDGDVCNGVNICDENAVCVAGTPANLDDGNPCTTDSCNPITGPQHDVAAEGTLCSEPSDLCVTSTCDGAGTCRPPTVVNPDDGNPCTVDSCDPALGVLHSPAPATTNCTDANPCNGVEICDGLGNCQAGVPTPVDDSNPCTDDECTPSEGVVHSPSTPGTDCGPLLVCDGEGACRELPPDPVAVAPPNDPGLATTTFGSTRFLYMGPSPIQVGVEEGTIRAHTAAVVRGTVLTRDGEPLPGVFVSIKNHPEFGHTFSRDDGGYDLAVNAGTELTLDYAKPNFLPAQRTINVPWETIVVADEVALVPLDTRVTVVDFADQRTAESSVTSDADGPRKAAVAFSAGTQAEMVLDDGTTVPLDALSLRLTEYTVGENGPAAMPASLPPTSGYTYAVNITADEALAAGADTVVFDRPVSFYVENFIGFPVGTRVPTAYYDADEVAWIGVPDGITLGVLDTNAGLAILDVNGDSQPATQAELDQLGITTDERAEIAALFAPGQSLWRARVQHFTPVDCNWPNWPPEDGRPPGDPPDEDPDDDEEEGEEGPEEVPDEDGDSCETEGSKIGVAAQSLGQEAPISGTPYRLNYSSRLVPGYTSNHRYTIQVTGSTVPDSLIRVELEVLIAGVKQTLHFPAEPNIEYTGVWDGNDAYGRRVTGRAAAQYTIRFFYPRVYQTPVGIGLIADLATQLTSFALASGLDLTLDLSRQELHEIPLSKTWTKMIGEDVPSLSSWDARGVGLGGWTLDVHHTYDPGQRAVILGTGKVRNHVGLFGPANRPLAGGGGNFCTSACCTRTPPSPYDACVNDGQSAARTRIAVSDALQMPDGSYLVTSPTRVSQGPSLVAVALRRIDLDGRLSTVKAANSVGFWGSGEFGPFANNAPELATVAPLARGPDGSVYLSVNGAPGKSGIARLDFVTPNLANVTSISGSEPGFATRHNIPALALRIAPRAIAVAPDGAAYVTGYDTDTAQPVHQVFRVGTDGMVWAVAGQETPGFSGDGGPSFDAALNEPTGLALDAEGNLYIADSNNLRIRRIGTNGIITTVAGASSVPRPVYPLNGLDPNLLDGEPATTVTLDRPIDIAAVAGGAFYVLTEERAGNADRFPARLRLVGGDGTIKSIVGQGRDSICARGEVQVLNTSINSPPRGVEVRQDGSLVVAALPCVRVLATPFPSLEDEDLIVPSEDGGEVYRFSQEGRHLDTRDGLTGGIIRSFGYDSAGRLASVADADGNTTRFERDAGGALTQIVAPYGQASTATLDENGFLESLVDPTGAELLYTYSSGGLMQTFEDARGGLHEFEYDDFGRLIEDRGPDGFLVSLDRDGASRLSSISRTTAAGRQISFEWEIPEESNGQERRVGEAGGEISQFTGRDGSMTTTYADGMQRRELLAPDPRYGMLAPYQSELVETTPNGLTRSVRRTLDTVGVDGDLTYTLTYGSSNIHTSTFDASTRTFTRSSLGGRTATWVLDESGRTSQVTLSGITPISISRDTRGRPTRYDWGARNGTMTYYETGISAGYLHTTTDPLGQVTTFTRDANGRVLSETRDGVTTSYTWDASGNLESVTPPGKPSHHLTHTLRNLIESYSPPPLGSESVQTFYDYDPDGFPLAETRPEGTIARSFDGARRPERVVLPGGQVDYQYYTFDGPSGGRLQGILGPYGVNYQMTYDGRLMTGGTWSGEVSGNVSWLYGSGFQKAQETVAGTTGTASTVFDYDNDLLLTCASPTTCAPPGADALILTRHPQHGMVSTISLGQTGETWSYNPYGELTQQTAFFNGSPLVDITYDEAGFERDALGRIVHKSETILGVTTVYDYRYDALQRLDQVKIDGAVDEEFTYDANGNRLTAFKQGVGTIGATYDDQDRLLTYGTWTFTYTANGELETKTNTTTGDDWAFQYDALGNLLSVGLPNGDLVEYLVDGMGRRVGKKKNGVLLKQWLYRDALKPAAELDGAGNLVAQFVYGSRPNVPDYVVRGGAMYRVVSDHLGSPRYVVNVANASDVPFSASYTSFGDVSGTGLDWMPFGFAGGLPDPNTGLVRFGVRDYDPLTGRWTAKDPVRFDGGQNLYGYVENDPVNRLDPVGHGPLSAFVVFAGCEVYALTGVVMDLINFNMIQDQMNEVRRQRDAADREIARMESCGDDPLIQIERRQFLDDELARLGKELAKFSPWGDLLAKEFVCIPLTLAAGLIPKLP